MATKANLVHFLFSGLRDPLTDKPLTSGFAYFYEAGTLTLKTVWTDANKTNTANNPVTLSAGGRASIFAEGRYKVRIERSDNTLVDEVDDIGFAEAELSAANQALITDDLADKHRIQSARLKYDTAASVAVEFDNPLWDGVTWNDVTGIDWTQLDTGAEQASKIYYVFLKWSLAGSTPVAGDFVISLNSTVSGAYQVGFFFNDASSNIDKFSIGSNMTADRLKALNAELLYEDVSNISVRWPSSLWDSDGWTTITGINFTNNLDTGSEAADTWYAVHLPWTLSGKLPSASDFVISTSETKADHIRIGWFRNGSGSDINKFIQNGKRFWVPFSTTYVNDGKATTYTAVDIRNAVPPTSRRVFLSLEIRDTGTQIVDIDFSLDGTNRSVHYDCLESSDNHESIHPDIPINPNSATSFYYKLTNLPSQGVDLKVTGWWEDNYF